MKNDSTAALNPKVILVCAENEEKQIYLDALASLDVSVKAVSSFKDLERILLETPYHGVLVDLKTKIRSLKTEKLLAHKILEQYPVVQLKLDDQTGQIRTLTYGKSKHDGTLEEFIESDCRVFEARSIRSNRRVTFHFNVKLSPTEAYSDSTSERTITINVSKGGCFIFSANQWQLNQLASFRILDLKDPTPIIGEVRWFKPWGESPGIPGIGLQFIDIKENQVLEFCQKCGII